MVCMVLDSAVRTPAHMETSHVNIPNLWADMYHRMQVMQFWKKAERVMVYKRQSQLDARKKVAMDKHLSFLVGSLDILKHGVAVHPLAAWVCYPLPGMMQ